MNAQRLETSRLFDRFGFGPRPGEYAQALKDGLASTRTKVLTVPTVDAGAAAIVEPEITDLGKRPEPNTKEIVPFAIALRFQSQQMVVCVKDATGKLEKKSLDVNGSHSFFGKAPFVLMTSGLAQADIFFQGYKVRVEDQNAKSITLEEVPF